MNLTQIYAEYPDPDACFALLERLRWAGKALTCPHCGGRRVERNKDRRWRSWRCGDCKSTFSALAGTIFYRTRIPLQKWFMATVLMMDHAKNRPSVRKLARELSLPSNTVRRMRTKIMVGMAIKQIDRRQCGEPLDLLSLLVGGSPGGAAAEEALPAARAQGGVKPQEIDMDALRREKVAAMDSQRRRANLHPYA